MVELMRACSKGPWNACIPSWLSSTQKKTRIFTGYFKASMEMSYRLPIEPEITTRFVIDWIGSPGDAKAWKEHLERCRRRASIDSIWEEYLNRLLKAPTTTC